MNSSNKWRKELQALKWRLGAGFPRPIGVGDSLSASPRARAGMARAAAGRGGGAGDKAALRLLALGGFDQRGALLLGGTADPADHHDRLGLVIGEKHFQHVDEVEPVDRVAAAPNAARLAEPGSGRLRHRLIGQSAGARDDADAPAAVDVGGPEG